MDYIVIHLWLTGQDDSDTRVSYKVTRGLARALERDFAIALWTRQPRGQPEATGWPPAGVSALFRGSRPQKTNLLSIVRNHLYCTQKHRNERNDHAHTHTDYGVTSRLSFVEAATGLEPVIPLLPIGALTNSGSRRPTMGRSERTKGIEPLTRRL